VAWSVPEVARSAIALRRPRTIWTPPLERGRATTPPKGTHPPGCRRPPLPHQRRPPRPRPLRSYGSHAAAEAARLRQALIGQLTQDVDRASYPNGLDAYYRNQCADTQYPRSFRRWRAIDRYARAGSRFGPWWWWSNNSCARWPLDPTATSAPWTARTSAPVLVVSNYRPLQRPSASAPPSSTTGPYKTIADGEYATAGWVDWYNNRRLHSTPGNVPPVEYEQAHYAALDREPATRIGTAENLGRFSGAADAKSSATSAVLYSPLCTRETRCASWRRLSLGCLPRSRPLPLATFMPSRVRRPDQVGLELGHHGKDVEQQSADRIGWVIDRPAQAQADLSSGELSGDRSGVGQGPGQTIELGHHQRVAGPTGGQCLAEPGTLAVGARSARDRRRSGQPRRRGRAGRRIERSGLVGRWSIGRTRPAGRSWRTSRRGARSCRRARPARASGGARLREQAPPKPRPQGDAAATHPRPAGLPSGCPVP
jgi:hypothetical protein